MNDTGIGAVTNDVDNAHPINEGADGVGSSTLGAEADEDSAIPAPTGPPQTYTSVTDALGACLLDEVLEVNLLQFNCGRMNAVCPECNALYWPREQTTALTYNTCCRSGDCADLPRVSWRN
mmetsp:Transcript_57733/g.84625  ORF Transcript_57733/g.84625 Transcript_57733/m.84625 type:complete len:121 (+) Transcript_57733:361-723(+)